MALMDARLVGDTLWRGLQQRLANPGLFSVKWIRDAVDSPFHPSGTPEVVSCLLCWIENVSDTSIASCPQAGTATGPAPVTQCRILTTGFILLLLSERTEESMVRQRPHSLLEL